MDNIREIIADRRELLLMAIDEITTAYAEKMVDDITGYKIKDPTCRVHIPISWIYKKVDQSDIMQLFTRFIAEEISYKVEQEITDQGSKAERFALDLVIE